MRAHLLTRKTIDIFAISNQMTDCTKLPKIGWLTPGNPVSSVIKLGTIALVKKKKFNSALKG